MICLMAPSTSALVLLIAFFILSSSTIPFRRLQVRPRPILTSFDLYIRPPPASLA
jgi:hypothetical protein